MAPSDLPKIVAICGPGATQQQISAALTNSSEFELVDFLSDPERLIRDLQAVGSDLMIIDHTLAGSPTLDLIDDLTLQFPNQAIIAILPGDDPVAAQQVMLAGARAFLIQPFTQVNLLSTLRRMRDLQARSRVATTIQAAGTAGGANPLHTMVVFSPRGGVGTSTVAVNTAIELVEEAGANVLLLEGKLFFGSLNVMLNIRSRNTLADLIPHSTAMDELLVREVVSEHVSGIHVLLAPSDLQIAQGIRAQEMFNVINSLKRYYDYIVIDAGSSLSEVTVTLMDAAERILLVASPDLAALHEVSRFNRITQTLAYPTDKTLLVLNRAEREGGVKASDIAAVLHQNIFAQIPDDSANALRSLNRGIPLVLNYPRSPASRAYKNLTTKLLELDREQTANLPSGRGTTTGAT
jgi:pilus assembly protein CpaE